MNDEDYSNDIIYGATFLVGFIALQLILLFLDR